jgi:HEAT repeat protein
MDKKFWVGWIAACLWVFLVGWVARAAVLPSSVVNQQLVATLKADLKSRKTTAFDSILKGWQKKYGPEAVGSLLHIAGDGKNVDPDRYIALMGAAKLGGIQAAPLLLPFLKDPSWMVRSGTLRALSALQNERTSQQVLSLLRDPALVVRLEAVDAVKVLRPIGAADALVSVLENGANYHGGKAQWVPQRALVALGALRAKEVAPRIARVLDIHHADPAFQQLGITTLEKLTGRTLAKGLPLRKQVQEWKVALAGKKTGR